MNDSKQQECLFCQIIAGTQQAHEIYRDEQCVAILDIFPLKSAHVLLISQYHAERFEQLPLTQAQHMSEVAQRLAQALSKAGFASEGYNLVINNGKVANQHIPHVHMHLIPRHKGDRLYVMWRYLTRFVDQLFMSRKEQVLADTAAKLRQYIA